VLFLDHRTLPFGNVVFDLGMEARRNMVRDYLTGIGVVLAGRFGEWEYYWSDDSLLSGLRAAEKAANRIG
jgi:protoporphyrinogen oxidase